MNSLCPLVVARLPLISGFDIAELVLAATGTLGDAQALKAAVHRTIQVEKILLGENPAGEADPFPIRFFKNASEKSYLQKRIEDYDPDNESYFLPKDEVAQ